MAFRISVFLVVLLGIYQALAFNIQSNIGSVYKRSLLRMLGPFHTAEETVDVKKLAGGMKYRSLPHSDLKISEFGLGTMTFGEQVKRSVAFDLLDKATKDYAINLVDTSEGFPLPLAESTYGHSESMIGDWLKQNPKSFRDKVLISSKVVGRSVHIDWMRNDNSLGTRLNEQQVEEAIDNSLRRLKTDYIDILSFQWPERYIVNNGGDQYFEQFEVHDATPIRTQLEFMAKLVKKGKIRHFALSNETPYGIGAFTSTADALQLPRPVFATNHYSLFDRYEFDGGMKEALHNAQMPFVAYSPLAGGALTGKYMGKMEDADDEWRMKRFPGFYARFVTEQCRLALKDYMTIATENFIPFTPMALAWVYQQSFVTSTLLGATTVKQLEENILAKNLSPLNMEMNEKLDRYYRKHLSAGRGPSKVQDPRIERYDPRRRPWGLREEDVDPELSDLLDDIYDKDLMQ